MLSPTGGLPVCRDIDRERYSQAQPHQRLSCTTKGRLDRDPMSPPGRRCRMTVFLQKPRSDGVRSGADIDATQMADIKAGREFSRKRKKLEAALYRAKSFFWEAGGKPAAMEEWSQKVMALELSRKAIKVAWTLSYTFNSTDGACFEKKSTLASRAGLSEQALKDGLTELEKMSLIKRQKEKRRGKILTVIYPAEPVLKGSSQSRQNEPEPSSLSRQSGSSLSRQNCLDTQDPCIPERS